MSSNSNINNHNNNHNNSSNNNSGNSGGHSNRTIIGGHQQELEEISIVSSNATSSQVTYGIGSHTSNGPRVVPGTITSGVRIGERRSGSGTRLNAGSPGGIFNSTTSTPLTSLAPGINSATLRTSTESLRTRVRSSSSLSKQSLLEIVSSRINANRNKPPQRYFSRESLAAGCNPNVGVVNQSPELDVNRSQKSTPCRRSQDKRVVTTTPAISVTSAGNSRMYSSTATGGSGYGTGAATTAPNKPSTTISGNNLSGVHHVGDSVDCSERQSRKSYAGGRKRSFGVRWSFVFDPAGRITYYWHMVVSLAFLYNLWVIVFRFSFAEINHDTIIFWFCFDYLSDFVYLLDILISFRIGFQDDGVLQTDIGKLQTHYMNSTPFYLDCMCLLPLDFLYLSLGFNSALRACRLVKVYRFFMFMDRTERHTNYPNLFRSLSLMHYLLIAFHWNGCLYHLMNKNHNFGSRNWIFEDSDPHDVVKQYLQSYYWCTLALTTIGDLPKPRSNFEYFFIIFQLLLGLLIFACVLGNVAIIVVSIGAAKKEFQAKLDGVKTYMRMRRVPAHLQTKVIRWFDYLWLTQECSDEERAISCLPDKLKAEIAINVHLDTLKRVEIFQNTEAGFLCELVLKLRPVLFSPGDYICRKGEVGKEMYIVSRGRLQVVADDGRTVLATLRAGSYFGEISILNMGTAGNRRTASVRSVGYSDLFVLSKKDMWDVLKEYPAARIRLEAIATKRLEKYRTDPEENLDPQGFRGRRCKSTPGIIESHERVALEDMWISAYTDNLGMHSRNLNFDTSTTLHTRSTSATAQKVKSLGSPVSTQSINSGLQRNQRTLGSKTSTLTKSNTVINIQHPANVESFAQSNASATEVHEVVELKAEINRLQDQLKDVENQNKFLNEKLTQQQWNMDHRLAEIEMQICRDTSSVGSSIDESERNRESVI